MGQGQSLEPVSVEELSYRLTESFATKCLSPLELYIFKAVFKNHATTSSGVTHWSQATLTNFLGLPTHPGLPIAHVIFQLAGYVGAFPFPSHAPAILTNEALLRVVVVLTGRYQKVLRGGRTIWEREIWRALAVVDRGLEASENVKKDDPETRQETGNNTLTTGFAVDQAQDEDEDEEEDDELVLSAFDAIDASDAFRLGEKQNIQHAMIPTDNFFTLIMFLLLIAPLGPQEPPQDLAVDFDDDALQDLRFRAHAILTSFGVEKHPGISYKTFRKVVPAALPHMFDSLQILFEHFFFPPDFDLHKRVKDLSLSKTQDGDTENFKAPGKQPGPAKQLLPDPVGELLTRSALSQISFVLPPATLFRNLTLLYSGADKGFSMPTFQNSVFGWQAPTLLIVSGTLIPDSTHSATAGAFKSSLPYGRFKPSVAPSQTVTYAAYIPTPWKQTHKASFGVKETLLLQLVPQHDVFSSTSYTSSYVYFNRYPSTYTGIGFGSPLAEENHTSASWHSMNRHNSGIDEKLPLGPVSLHMDDSLTYAVFTHDSRGVGTFSPSPLPAPCRLAPETEAHGHSQPTPTLSSPVTSPPISPDLRKASPSRTSPLTPILRDWQDVFEIEALEVYGLGGVEVAEEQERARIWEAREVERRRAVQLKTGDIDADRELLKLAGLISDDRSGGSMG